MRHAAKLCVALLLLLAALPCLAAEKQAPAFRRPLQNLAAPLAGPPSWNKGEAQGWVYQTYLSGSFGAFEISLPDFTGLRFDCGNSAAQLGCAALNYGDTVLVRYRLSSLLAPYCGPWDGIIDVGNVVLLYRWTGSTWQLLTTP